jgi:hypothetical protein
MLMQFDTYELRQAASFLGPFCFSSFIFLVVFVCMSMFITIINDDFRVVKEKSRMNVNKDQEILVIMFGKLRRWISMD